MGQERYTTTYRAAEAHQVMSWIEAGQSGCLIGLRGAGKSNFLHFLLRQDVRQHYLGQDRSDFIFILIDFLALTECTAWAVCELMLDRLLAQLRPLGVAAEAIDECASLRQDATHSRDSLAAWRAVERCVAALCAKPTQCIVLLLDEFDVAFRTLDPFLFRCLRALRDAHKDQVSYVVVAADDLARLRSDLSGVEPFYHLVSRNVCGLGPYSAADALLMTRHLTSRRSIELSERDTARLIELTGGHAGLLKAVLSRLWDAHRPDGLAEIALTLRDEPTVQAECREVWTGLPEDEQAALCALASGAPIDPHMLQRLELKGLVRTGGSQSPVVFSPLFADWMPSLSPPQGVVISRTPRQVQIGGRCIETLTELEFEMLCYLYERRGQVCTKDELIANVYRRQYDRMAGGVTDEALQTLIARLRAKIEPDSKRPRYIVTARGEGYRFGEP